MLFFIPSLSRLCLFFMMFSLADGVRLASADSLTIPISATYTGDSANNQPPVVMVPISLPAGSVITRLGYNTQVTVSSLSGPDGNNGDEGFTVDFVLSADGSTATGPDVYNYLFPNFLEVPQTKDYSFPVMPLTSLPYPPPDTVLPASITVPFGQPKLMLFGYFYSPRAGVVVSGSASLTGSFTLEYDAPPAFRVLSFANTGGQVALTWQSVSGREYQVQESADLTAWAVRHTISATTPATSASITPTLFPGGRGFYRIRLVP